jgi:hypothetical protein
MFDFQIGKMTEFVHVKLMQVAFSAQLPAHDPYCAVSIKEAIADASKFLFSSDPLSRISLRTVHFPHIFLFVSPVATFCIHLQHRAS